tara:strand:+ start:318 stop:551 length:234 start_codon:yes stop_codon:yes gene_type:complete
MSKNKNKICPYEHVRGKLESIETKLLKTKQELEVLSEKFAENPEICRDVEESEKALQDALDSLFAEELLTKKPIGDA